LFATAQAGEPPAIAGAWFTYDPAGLADDPAAQHWFTLLGHEQEDGRYQVDLMRTIGARFDAGATSNTYRVGSASIAFDGCRTARLDYRFDEGGPAAEFSGQQGSIHLVGIGDCGNDGIR
jgi:hypothetical protein